MTAKTNDTLYLAIGGVALLGAGIWALVQQSSIASFRTDPIVPAAGLAYEAQPLTVTTPASERWLDVSSQPAGPLWIYDVFTPPAIYYNTQTQQFTVVPPPPSDGGERPVVGPVVPEFGLELVKVEQPLFRLQLVGYVGEGEQARGNFMVVETGDVVFGTRGKKFPNLNLEIVSFSAERRRIEVAGATTQVFVEVKAVVRDTVTGVETKLDNQTRVPEGPLSVTFKQLPDGGERQARAGETFTIGDQTYTVGALTLEPPSAVVTREVAALPAPEVRTLVIPPPAPPAAPEGASSGNESEVPADGASAAFPGF